MEKGDTFKEILIILAASIILGACYSFPDRFEEIITFSAYFFLIIGISTLVKKYFAYLYEADIKTKFWSIYHYGFLKGSHFKKPLFMGWFPIFVTLISKGYIQWFSILESEIKPRIERVARRHEGMYRFTEMTEEHIAYIMMWGIIANLMLAIIGYILGGVLPGGELFAKLNIYYAFWSLLPVSSLDGTKLFVGSRGIWYMLLAITLLFLVFSLFIII